MLTADYRAGIFMIIFDRFGRPPLRNITLKAFILILAYVVDFKIHKTLFEHNYNSVVKLGILSIVGAVLVFALCKT